MQRRAFSFVDFLAVIATVGILVGLVLIALDQFRIGAQRTHCMNNVRQITQAHLEYESVHGKFPAGSTGGQYWGRDAWSWYCYVLPFLQQSEIYQELNFTTRFNGAPNRGGSARKRHLPIMLCPSDTHKIQQLGDESWQHALHNYVVCYGDSNFNSGIPMNNRVDGYEGTAGMFVPQSASMISDCTDGISNTLMVAEIITPESELTWSALGRTQVAMGAGFTTFLTPNSESPDRLNRGQVNLGGHLGPKCVEHAEDDWGANVVAARSWHRSTVVTSFADGSVHSMGAEVNSDTWRALGGRSDGISLDRF